jgi:hypothetical protein
MLGATRDISWSNILCKSFIGRVFDSEGAKDYINSFFSSLPAVRNKVDNLVAKTAGMKDLFTMSRGAAKHCAAHGAERTVAQLVGIHVSWANFAGGGILLLGSYIHIDMPLIVASFKEVTAGYASQIDYAFFLQRLGELGYMIVPSLVVLPAVSVAAIVSGRLTKRIVLSALVPAILLTLWFIWPNKMRPILYMIVNIVSVPLILFVGGILARMLDIRFLSANCMFVAASLWMVTSIMVSYTYMLPENLIAFLIVQQILMTFFISHAADVNYHRKLSNSEVFGR